MKILEILKAHGAHTVGDVAGFPDELAARLIKHGIAKEADIEALKKVAKPAAKPTEKPVKGSGAEGDKGADGGEASGSSSTGA